MAQLEQLLPALIKTFVISHDADDDVRLAKALVFNAARLAWRLRINGVDIDTKSNPTDLVTTADIAAEKFISGALAALRPDDGVMGEEGAHQESTSGRTWIIDPVDGTYNFASGSDYFCCALGLVEGHPDNPSAIILGAVHRPAMGYTWIGGPNLPTTRDDEPVSPIVDQPLSKVCLGTYMHPALIANGKPFVAGWLNLVAGAATVRLLGSASVDLASLADGVIGAWAQHSVKSWDWIPGRALVEGAGGTTRTITAGGISWCLAGSQSAVDDMERRLSAPDLPHLPALP
ncbi:fructose 1,6-bisphosphatase [Corynebacterium aquilae DSM 44791]|uniref:Fructose 1,6-bisphosphatase n=1 Tax=Corynebacterium aquilae DSM 44791 TaxID=1431546 RepID=A0A1L7CEM5_9CORY|nr:fructose 1,6-bisphosphatase [Corynebacterium aquilae DSM 44791]